MAPSTDQEPPSIERETETDVTPGTCLRLPPDAPGRRLGWAVLVSILANLALWQIVSGAAGYQVVVPPTPIEVTRIILPPIVLSGPRPPRKKITRNKIVRRTPRPSPSPRPISRPQIIPTPKMAARPKTLKELKRQVSPRPVTQPRNVLPPKRLATPRLVAAPPPPAPHRDILTARGPAPKPNEFSTPNIDHPMLGKLNEHQGMDNTENNPPKPVMKPLPQPVPTSAPPAPHPLLAASSLPTPKQELQPDSVRRGSHDSGPTQDAEPAIQVNPEIPEDLRQDSFKTFVRVSVEIEADGRFAVTLRTSSGNAEIDRRVLEALNRWKWRPALQNGKPVKSTKRFKLEFEVN